MVPKVLNCLKGYCMVARVLNQDISPRSTPTRFDTAMHSSSAHLARANSHFPLPRKPRERLKMKK